MQQLQAQAAMHFQRRGLAIQNLRALHAQMAAVAPRAQGREAMQPLLFAEHQLRMQIGFHENEMARLQQALAAARPPPTATTSAERRALQLQSGQMYAAIKALSQQITTLASVPPTQTTGRQLQLLNQQRHVIVMQLHRLRQQIASLGDPEQGDTEQGGPAEYNNLMTEQEKQQLVNIQRIQMHSDNPYIDDYYYMMHVRKRTNIPLPAPLAAAAAAAMTPGLPSAPPGSAAAAATTASGATGGRAAIHLDNTLGFISLSNLRAPKALIEVDQGSLAPSEEAEPAPRNTWKEALRAVEQGFSALLRVSDIDRSAEDPTSDRRALFEQRKALIAAVMAGLGIAERDTTAVGHVLGVRKGVRLLGRLVAVLTQDQVALLISTLLLCPVAPDEKAQGELGNPAVQKMGELSLPAAISVVQALLASQPEDKPIALNAFQCILLSFVCQQIDMLLASVPPMRPETNKMLDSLCQRICGSLGSTLSARKDQALWTFVGVLASHSTPPSRKLLADAVGPSMERDAATPLAPLISRVRAVLQAGKA